MIIDPTTRGHLMNDGFSDPEMRMALQESNIISLDEGHQFATGRTAAIRGAGTHQPSTYLVERTTSLFNQLDSYVRVGDAGNRSINSSMVTYVESSEAMDKTLEKLNNAGDSDNIGVVVFMGDPKISDELEARLTAQGYSKGEIWSVLKALVTEADTPNSYYFGVDEKGNSIVFPVDEYGVHQTEQINNNTIEDIARVLKYKDDPRFENLNLDPQKTVRVQNTEISTSLASAFENYEARKVAASATLEGLDQLVRGRVGSKIVNISGASLDLDALVLKENKFNLKEGAILQDGDPRFAGLNLTLPASESKKTAEFQDLVKKMRDSLAGRNVIIATENPELIKLFREEFQAKLVINGATSADDVNIIAKGKDPATNKSFTKNEVIIINPRAYTGVNFQMHADLFVIGAEKLADQMMVQLLKRVNGPNPITGIRWDATRYLVL